MKKILGLDLGTNSIGWALINQDDENNKSEIIKLGSRIIPMSEDILGKFDSGVTESDTAKRTAFRGVRRLRERHLLRRERLHRVLNILNYLPEHYSKEIDFEKRFGQFNKEAEPKIAYSYNEETKAFEFVFKNSFAEMVEYFKKVNPELFYIKQNGKETKIPYDWTIYYLRKKALTKKIEKEELAWLLLNFNQKRGYYQLRGEEDEDATRTAKTRIYFAKEIIVSITDTGKKYKDNKVLEVELQNGVIGKIFKKEIPNWIGLEKNIIATIDLDKDGNDKYDDDKKLSQRFSIPTEADWEKEWKLIKIKTENDLKESKKTVGSYIYDTLLQNPTQKINGKLVRVIERKFYKDELSQILETQVKYHPELQDKNLLAECLEELYEYNESHRNSIGNKGFEHLFLNDIIFYQRPLKSKKSLISDCKFESRTYLLNGEKKIEPIKCIAKSHPLFQEFRLWQWLKNLRIYEKETDKDVTDEMLSSEESWINLFDWLNDRKEVEQEQLIKFLLSPLKLKPKALTIEVSKYRWNFVEDKKYPCNETRSQILTRLAKVENVPDNFLTKEVEEALWHILYSVNDKLEIPKALKSFATKYHLDDDFVELFKKFPPYKNEYGSYSAKAIKKILPLMRMGKYWNEENIHLQTKDRIDKILNSEYDETIRNRVREKAINLNDINDFKGLPLWLTSYIVYDRHSEDGEISKWKTPQELEKYLKEFKQHSLRNPIVEQVITETLRVVKDIWNVYGKGADNFFDEIHIELGREMKNPADKRSAMTKQITENENTNLRIKALLAELMNDTTVENVRPYSPSQQEILKIYEEYAVSNNERYDDTKGEFIFDPITEDIEKISKTAQPSKNDLIRYKLWLEQRYRSPYTGDVIPLGKLFTTAYEIEHIIPQSRFFDDSFSNKVICESEVNKLKDKQLGLEFILSHGGEKVILNYGKSVEILKEEEYKKFVNEHYAKNYSKKKKLLLDDIPEKMIERQMNDTRYISKMVKNLMSNIVRKEKDDDGTTSVNVLSSNGQITNTLKQDWGLNDIWNEIITPRFERLNVLTNSTNFGSINPKTNKFLPTVPLELSKGFTKKRIDHRHHAMDALVIACANRNHINYLNNQNAVGKEKNKESRQKFREDLKHLLCDKKFNEESNNSFKWVFKKPWETFTQEVKQQLLTTIVSFKQNLRVINKTVNKYESWKDEEGNLRKDKNGKLQKGFITQTKGDSWAIRKPMHKDTVSGKVDLKWIKVPKGKILTATRKSIDSSFDLKTIETITDTGIQKILKNYLASKNNNTELSFSPEGIEELNNNIKMYNDGKPHQPIYKVRVFESGSKFALGETGNKMTKYAESAKGTNLFLAIYQNKSGKRDYETIPLNIVIERQKQGLSSVSETNEKGDKFLFYLSPNDLVYLPTADEKENMNLIDFENLTKEKIQRIYRFTDGSGVMANFIPSNIASVIFNLNNDKQKKVGMNYPIQNEIGVGSQGSKNERAITGETIKSLCLKLKVDRLGNINQS